MPRCSGSLRVCTASQFFCAMKCPCPPPRMLGYYANVSTALHLHAPTTLLTACTHISLRLPALYSFSGMRMASQIPKPEREQFVASAPAPDRNVEKDRLSKVRRIGGLASASQPHH